MKRAALKLGPKRRLRLALNRVQREISDHARTFGGSQAGEGYSGGYADALMDVELLLNGCLPNRRDYWRVDPE